MRHLLRLLPMLLLVSFLASCTKAHDLDAPCPDFGRHCPQTPINDLF